MIPGDLDRLFQEIEISERMADERRAEPEGKKLWRMRDGKLVKLSDMTLGHLSSSIRMMGAKLEQAKEHHEKASRVNWIEAKLMELQAELDSRGKEIDQLQGIARALENAKKTLDD